LLTIHFFGKNLKGCTTFLSFVYIDSMRHPSASPAAKKTACVFLLLLLAAFAGNAASPSLFVSPGQVIENGAILRVYSLEYGGEALANGLAEFAEISGAAQVAYANGRTEQAGFGDLLARGAVSLVFHEPPGYLGFYFADTAIVRITAGPEGIGLFRRQAAQDRLARNNAQRIGELERQGYSRSAIQESIWRNRIFRQTWAPQRLTVDFQTTEGEGEQVSGVFGGSATVSYRREGRTFLRIDGLLNRSSVLSEHTSELLTHYHTDHISRTVAERALREGRYSRMIAPYPLLDASRVRAFFVLAEHAGIGERERPDNLILDIAPQGASRPAPPRLGITDIGEFYYSSFSVGSDIAVEMFRYHRPRDVNSDGLLYRVTHKSVSYLLFGDFDDPAGIEKLLDISAANERRRIGILEERSRLTVQLLGARAANDARAAGEAQGRIMSLDGELSRLPILKADVIKWPHHAHRFPNNETADGIVRKMNEVVDPYYIIWQRHHTQRGFADYITRFDFAGKFLSSDDMEIVIISMCEPAVFEPSVRRGFATLG